MTLPENVPFHTGMGGGLPRGGRYTRSRATRCHDRISPWSADMAITPAFLFDLDGTLVDSVYQHVLA